MSVTATLWRIYLIATDGLVVVALYGAFRCWVFFLLFEQFAKPVVRLFLL